MEIIEVKSITNHGSVIQIVGLETETKRLRSVVGDWRMMRDAIRGLGIEVGSHVGLAYDDDGHEYLTEPD